MRILLAILVLFYVHYGTGAYTPMHSVPQKNSNVQMPFSWTMLEYSFPSESARQEAIANDNYVQNNGLPIDVQPHYYNKNKMRTFVTIPRFQTGIPYTLATVSDELGPSGPVLKPYPSYEAHNVNGDNCDRITSVFRVAITECNQMWVLDSGSVGLETRCPPRLLLFDLNTDQLLHRYTFNTTLYTPSASLLVTPIVDVKDPPPRGSCRRAMIYVADVNYHGLIVYDFMANDAWRVENKFMYPDPDFGTHTVAGESFILMDGIIGMTTDRQNLYFHAMASTTEYAVPLNVLENRDNFINGADGKPRSFNAVGKRSSECVATATDSRDNVYCVTFNPVELISWNVNTPYSNKSFKKIPINSQLIEFVSGMKVVTNNEGKEELWMISNRFQKVAASTQNTNEVNFRIVVYTLGNARSPNVGGGGGGNRNPNFDLHNKLIFSH